MKAVFILFRFDGGRIMTVEKGFSLIELLIVVAIIAIIAAIAIPNLQTSRQAANEASAMQGCRTIGGYVSKVLQKGIREE
jgi:prepilin-type N-terminal cleavage/methylation domain-containing protein